VTLKTEVIARGLSEPWALAALPDGGYLVTERTGKLLLITRQGERSEIAGVPAVDTRGQGGLMDISLAPDFETTREIYVTFSEPRGEGKNGTSLARAKLSSDRRRLEGMDVIFRQTPAWASPLHFGSNIEWDQNGFLYVTLGERSLPASRGLAQDKATHLGKVVRLTRSGAAAPGNPFESDPSARAEIWSMGHRNVQGAAIHPTSGRLWTIEHGPRGGDELNIPKAGANYGWPIITYGIDYPGGPIGEGITSRAGLEQPTYYWDPVIAPGDMTFYKGSLFPWTGDLLIAGLSGSLVRLELSGEKVTGEERLGQDIRRIRDVLEDSDGSLLIVTDEANGVLARLTPG
jgi:glucose/arabinose dehydrogenase